MDWFETINQEYESAKAETSPAEGVSEVISVSYEDLAAALEQENPQPFVDLVRPLWGGAVLLLKQAFSPKDVSRLKQISLDVRGAEPPSFHKVVEGVPNFWRDIGEEEMGSYALAGIKKSVYFFPWNRDSKDAFEIAYPRWRVLKTLAGLAPNMYEDLTPKDGKVDRLQIVEYPAGTGFLAPHQDPDHNQRLIMSAYLSKRGNDYGGGGFWALDKNGKKIEVEDFIDVGDLGTCVASIVHGVDATEAPRSLNETASSSNYGEAELGSRWFVGFYTNDSDEVSNRKTVRQVQLP